MQNPTLNSNSRRLPQDGRATFITPFQQQFVCSMCCDHVSADESIILQACSHQGCKACKTKWIKIQEESGQSTAPTCPFCRADIDNDDVVTVLGRPFKQREAIARPTDEEIDELTLQWFNDQTTLCPGCGSRVQKVDGCDHMTCLCGCEFCFECGSIQCLCSDNGRTYTSVGEPIRDYDGTVNLRACLQRKNGKGVRRDRALRRYENMAEEENRWMFDDEWNSCDGKWLFSCSEGSKSVVVLTQLYKFSSSNFRQECETKRQVKQQRRYQIVNEEEHRWMSIYARVRSSYLPVQANDAAFEYNSSDGRWLFSCRKSSTSAIVLVQQCNSIDIRRQRYQRDRSNQDIIPVCPSWLF
mmetsp:Transcript_39516/g.85222  ORF Transcript_39516/g.85222 Transcript_39516/m.85222 type:complete len:355 (+) Transcript_39516:38-1102(+)